MARRCGTAIHPPPDLSPVRGEERQWLHFRPPYFSLSLAGGGSGWGSRQREERERTLRRPRRRTKPADYSAMTAAPMTISSHRQTRR